MFENARWIARNVWKNWKGPSVENMPPSPFIAKTFELDDAPKSAVLNICALGQGAYYINGDRVPDSFLPSHPSNYDKCAVYSSYDVTSMLKKGKNRLGVIVGNTRYADSRSGYLFNYPKMICQLDVEYSDGRKLSVVSDTSFKTADSFVLFSYARCGEIQDANLKIDNWCSPDFDDSAWENAKVSPGPGGILRPTKCPPRRKLATLEGKEIAKGVFDFGINTSGFANVKIKGKKGDKIEIYYTEDLSEDGLHVGHTFRSDRIDCKEMKHKGIYILSGENDEFEDLFSYHGFQYVELVGEYESAQVCAYTVHTDIKETSHFECDNEMINKIYKMCSNSILTNCHVAMLDCPQREQNEWTGDGMMTAQTVSQCYDAYDMYYEWMLKFQDDQSPDGRLPCIVPAYTNLDIYNGNGLDWSSAVVFIPYYAYKYTGNIEIVRTMWDNMERMLHYYSRTSMTHLIDSGLGDWTSLDGDKVCPVEITDTCFYRIDALMMAEMATALGKDVKNYLTLAEEIKKEYREKYVEDGRVKSDNFTAIVCSAYAGMLEESEIKKELERGIDIVKKNGKGFTSGTHGYMMMFDVLTKYGFVQDLFDIIVDPSVPGYAKSVSEGYTTIPEIFSHIESYSRNHQFKAMINSWMFRFLAGVDVNGFGFDDVVIEPYFVKGIDTLSATVIGVSVSYDKNSFTVESPYDFTLKLFKKEQKLKAGKYTFDR